METKPFSFEVKGQHFYKNGKKHFLNSGEIHYFRIKRERWETHLRAALEAGLDTVSTYIPWAWHEFQEGEFDFSGYSHPQRDLIGWIELCKSLGLQLILKPGPFILAEFRGAGLPDWFLEKHGQDVKMLNSAGQAVPSDGVSLFHPFYLEKVSLWYDRIMPLIAGHSFHSGGPVIMMQICNEIGVFSWLAHQADYSTLVNPRWEHFLKETYSSISQLNQHWGTQYKDFNQVELPPDGKLPYASPHDRCRDYQWHCFWRKYYGDYLRMLVNMARQRGIQLPVYHNLPGWIYGSGYEFPVNITMYDDLYGDKSEIIFGVDHIPEYLSYRNMHDDRIINDITAAMQGNKPLFAAEFQSGSREYHVVTNPREMELFYKASIANGLAGWNYYMFSQGKNEARKGYSGDTFYWFNPMSAEGQKSSAFPLVQRMSQILHNAEDIILNSKRKAEICVLFYPPYYATELERPETGASNLDFVPSAIRRPAYFDGLLKILQVLNVEYDMLDLTKTSASELSAYKQVWAFCTNEMNAPEQNLLATYVVSGGQLAIFPSLPDRDFAQQPCTILRELAGISPVGKEFIDSPLIDLQGLPDIKCANPQMVFDEKALEPQEIIARTISGKPCGFIRSAGKGSILHLGTWLGFDTEGHKPAYLALLNLSDANLYQARATSDYITVRQRFANEQALLFIGNYYNETHASAISYKHPITSEEVKIPLLDNAYDWPALYGLIIPIGLEITKGIRILHATSDILRHDVVLNEIRLELFGDADLPGELVLEGADSALIAEASLNGTPCLPLDIAGRKLFRYAHQKNQKIQFTIKLK